MTATYRMPLPVHLERAYGLFGKRLIGHFHEVGIAAFNHYFTIPARYRDQGPEDLDEEIDGQALLAAMAALGISFATLLDEEKLRMALRRVARSNDIIVKQQLAAALGRPVVVDVSTEIDEWIEAQAKRITKLVNRWYASVAEEIESAETLEAGDPGSFDMTAMVLALAAKKRREERVAFAAAAGGLLLLNSALVAANAVGAGVQSFIWRTEADDRVRDHHADLEGTIQRFDSPPIGGGTTEEDVGLPGEGINCRCVAELIIL